MRVNGEPAERIAANDRGVLYGDGLFETIRFQHGRAPLWPRHMARLARGCERLQLPVPDMALLWREALAEVAGREHAVVRITLTRGVGTRGYAQPAAVQPTRIVAASPLPRLEPAMYRDGIRLHRCATQLGDQPRLAGIKHLNRLEQVLARAEWNDPAIVEGLVCDIHGNAISATAANLFAVIGDVVVTPAVDRCGVAGVMRAELLECLPHVAVRDLPLAECLAADEVFLSSSVRGILPVRAIGDTRFAAPGPVARAMQAHWRDLGFSMEHA